MLLVTTRFTYTERVASSKVVPSIIGEVQDSTTVRLLSITNSSESFIKTTLLRVQRSIIYIWSAAGALP